MHFESVWLRRLVQAETTLCALPFYLSLVSFLAVLAHKQPRSFICVLIRVIGGRSWFNLLALLLIYRFDLTIFDLLVGIFELRVPAVSFGVHIKDGDKIEQGHYHDNHSEELISTGFMIDFIRSTSFRREADVAGAMRAVKQGVL